MGGKRIRNYFLEKHQTVTFRRIRSAEPFYVEDDFANRKITKFFLKNICMVETAEDGETALHLAAEKKYDLILMDINLGGEMNGMEVVQKILKKPKYVNTPIIAVTA